MDQLPSDLLQRLEKALGPDGLRTDLHARTLYAQDVFTKDLPVLAVLRPKNIEELAGAVNLATAEGLAIVPRGGGMSYSSGYVPMVEQAVTLDMSGMNRVLEINDVDMYVTVECGCTWQELHEILEPMQLRTTYWGTLSGRMATVGGSLSQNSIFWGSGQYGTAADCVLSLQVVLADGTILETGSQAQRHCPPFFRHYGPDLTGIFTSDCGALGTKATATLRLMPTMSAQQYCAFDFEDGTAMLNAMSAISRSGLATECFGFDPFLQMQRMKRDSVSQDVASLANVMKKADSVTGALKEGAKIALAGRRYMTDVDYSLQVITEDLNQIGADERAKQVKKLALGFGAREIENSIPKIVRANPFGPLNNMVGPNGERWVPSHVLVPHSRAVASYQEILNLFDSHADEFSAFEIQTGFLFATISTNGFVIEPVFYWPDALTEIHEASVEEDHIKRLQCFPENLEARQKVAQVRNEFAAHFCQSGGIHLQIGKSYRYKEGLQDNTLSLLKSIKTHVDPKGLMNPGSLGLDASS